MHNEISNIDAGIMHNITNLVLSLLNLSFFTLFPPPVFTPPYNHKKCIFILFTLYHNLLWFSILYDDFDDFAMNYIAFIDHMYKFGSNISLICNYLYFFYLI